MTYCFQYEKATTKVTTVKHFTADRHSQLNSQFLNLTLQIIWCLFLRGAILLLRITKATEYRVLIQYSKGRQAFSSQTTILRNIISLVKLLKGKKRQSFHGLPFLFAALSKLWAKQNPGANSSSVSVHTDSACPNPNPLRKLRRNPCTKTTRTVAQTS